MSFQVYNCDVLDGFKKLDDNSIDLIVTSPPYNVSIEYDSWNDNMNKKDYFDWVNKWLLECYRVLKPDGRIAINIPFEVNMKQIQQRVFICSEYWQKMFITGFNWSGIIRLNEIATQRAKFTAWGSWMSPSMPYCHNAEECVLLAYKEVPKKLEKGETDLTKEEFVEYVSGVWGYRAETQPITKVCFSEDIPSKSIKLLTWIGDTVLDPFTGSGTTGLSCAKLKRNFIGFEISENYCKIARNRIQDYIDRQNCSLKDMIF